MQKIVFSLFLILSYNSVFSQCNTNALDLGPDTTICENQSYILNAGTGFLSYSWSTGSTSSYIIPTVAGQYVCSVTVPGITNLISNGDFTQGNTGFTSSYVYGTGGSWGLLSNPGEYAVSINANLTHNNFPSCSDHTSGTGNYMIMNGSSTANTNVWCQNITVTPSTTYELSAWFTSVVGGSPAQLNFSEGGIAIGALFTLGSSVCNWTNYSRTWTSGPSQTTASICITSQSTAGGGNDFAIDDISLTQVCTSIDTINISIDTLPLVNLGPDTVACNGSNLVLDATDNPAFSYQWSSGVNSAINSVTSTDSNLIVTVTNGQCSVMDDIIVTFSSQPNVSLGPDTTLCPGDFLNLSAVWPNATYQWSDNSSQNNLSVTQAGQYWVEVTDACGVTNDSIQVNYIVFPLIELGADTNICDGESLSLDASYPGATYLWNTGDTDSVITISQSGVYSVQVGFEGCTDLDTLSLIVDANPVVELGVDTTICDGENYLLQANNLNATYLWSDNSMGAINSVTTTGEYWVEVSINNCKSSDTVNVTVLNIPFIELGTDTILCGNMTMNYDVTQPNVNYLWNDNSTNSTLNIAQTTKVWAEVSNVCGTESDTVNVYVNPLPIVDLGNDTIICEGEKVIKNVTYPGGSYQWNDGSTFRQNEFSESGIYSVKITARGCSNQDSFLLTIQKNPELDLGEDTNICNNTNWLLNAGSTYDEVNWGDGSNGESIIINSSGKYWVEVTSGVCLASDTIWVSIVNCDVYAEIPNVFTPNGDGINDVFKPVYTVGVDVLKTTIFNRWGEELFSTIDPQINWDGKDKNGNLLPSGVYFWVGEITGVDGIIIKQKGTISLFRNE